MSHEQENYTLKQASRVKWQQQNRCEGLGKVLDEYVGSALHTAGRVTGVQLAWDETVGPELSEKTRIVSIEKGVVKVEVPSGPYLYELKQAAFELLKELRQKCPRANLKRIKITPRR